MTDAARGRDEADKLLYAVGDYVKSIGGNVVVAGGIIIEYDPTSKYRFVVRVQCTGKAPDGNEQE